LVRIGLEHPRIRYEIFYGASDNERAWWDNAAAYRYGYRPQFRSEDLRDAALAVQARLPTDPVSDWYQGGTFCSDEYRGAELAEY
jgi:uronate dehydrogenase